MADAIIVQVYSDGCIMATYVLELSFSVKSLHNIFLWVLYFVAWL